ncbi:aldehyde dehydrogenase [Erythrobacter sp. HL-111]|uniref:aldehyde dehydrogenase family protein n=1 Tax=Erythrobacter sp. HL-111 TaxID=1798193 RepID=UPI0006D9CDEB|nr:aldehyde dehydrogenase family protein [Erythrobacter sp. HL-111]KPP96295.1 MAG: phenylacetaldehyde dehydrogenase [Erythrobacteraceae bacterium HL-111]SDR74407.1 aldehyde dehydrogenase (acceptor) [Erythrobacter sp. HL-111]
MALIDLAPETRSFIGSDKKMLIGGEWTEPSKDAAIPVINPADGETLARIGDAAGSDVDRAVKAARRAFDEGPWRTMKPGERALLLHRIADAMAAHAEQLAQLETLDNGKPIAFARMDVQAAIGAMRYYAGWADKIHGSTHSIAMPGEHHVYTLKEPVGVAALIVPWNYPLVMAAMKLGPCLAAGCTAVLKPAEDTSLSALRLGEIMLEAGLPEGVLNIVTGHGHTAGDALVHHPGIDKIAFTGSTATGKAIAHAAAEGLKKVSLELGGKSPNIIMPDADLDAAIPASAFGIFYNSGQTCTAPSRLYVHEDVADTVIEGIAAFGKSMTIAPGLDEDSQIGPLVSQKQFDRVTGYVRQGEAEGAEIVSGGRRHGNTGYFIEPTVIAKTTNDMTVVREEIFGPVLVTQTFASEEEAIALANDNPYGLAGCVWTRDMATAHTMAKKIRAGIIGLNTAMGADWDVPLGGYKQSGIGRENGRDGLELYLATKSVFAQLKPAW